MTDNAETGPRQAFSMEALVAGQRLADRIEKIRLQTWLAIEDQEQLAGEALSMAFDTFANERLADALSDNEAAIEAVLRHPALADYRLEHHQVVDILGVLRRHYGVEGK